MYQDPQQALQNAQNLVQGKGFLGFITKLFLGKGAAQQMSATIAQAQGQLGAIDEAARIRATGRPTQARVLHVADTGSLVNFDPVLRLRLEVIPPAGGPNYVAEIQSIVSKIAIPRVGDVLGVAVDPTNANAIALAS